MKLDRDSPLLSTAYVVSPVIGYIPQILTRDILFSPLISMFFIMSNILKIFHYHAERYSRVLLFQHAFIIMLHTFLILMNRRPLSIYETKILRSRTTRLIYQNYGIKGCVLGILCMFMLVVNVHGVMHGSYALCGRFASVLEVGVNLFQLVLERKEKKEGKNLSKRSPKELYLCWIVGDIIKIWFMSSVDAPMIFIGTIIVQIVIDISLIVT